MCCEFVVKSKLKNNLQLNHCRYPDYALSIKTRTTSAICCYEEKVNCQLGHPFSTVTVYIANCKIKLERSSQCP